MSRATDNATAKEKPRRWELEVLTPAEADDSSFRDDSTWADADATVAEDNALWRQYEVLVDLYKYYLDIAWKVSAWYYATTGVILAYFFEHVGDDGSDVLPLLLLFLAGASIGFAYLAWRGGGHLFGMIRLLESIAKTLGLPGRPHVEFACIFLLISSVMFTVIGLAAVGLYIRAPWEG